MFVSFGTSRGLESEVNSVHLSYHFNTNFIYTLTLSVVFAPTHLSVLFDARVYVMMF